MQKIPNVDKLQLYANDTLIYTEGKTEEEVVDKVNTMLERLNNWYEANKININVKKSKSVIFGNRKTQ